MEIIGNNEFITKTKKALKIIKDKDFLSYNLVAWYISRLIENEITFLYPYEDISCYIGDEVNFNDSVMYASQIIREAYHSFLVKDNLIKNYSGDFECYDGRSNMIKSYNIQIIALKKLGGSEGMIKQVNLELHNKLKEKKDEIRIIGSKTFIKKINDAMELLRIKDNESYQILTLNIGKIVQFNDSAFTYFDRFQDVPTIFINNSDLNSSIYELSSGLLHEAYHSKLYKDAKVSKKNPEVECHGYSAEMYCLTKEIECLKKIGAPDDVIQYYTSCYDTKWWEKPNEVKYSKKYNKEKITYGKYK